MEGISLIPNSIFQIGNISINSSIAATLIVTILIFCIAGLVKNRVAVVPGRGMYVLESLVGFFYDKAEEVTNNKKFSMHYTSLIFSFFLFIFISNQFSLIPLIQSFVINGEVVFRTPTAHFSQTIALALVTVIVSNILALYVSPIKHLDNLFNIKSLASVRSVKDLPKAFLDVFIALLNVIGELSKVISLAARLFGNIFAGEVMIAIIAGLSVYTAFLVPIPFMLISIFSGIIQAFVFSLLAFSFITGSVEGARE